MLREFVGEGVLTSITAGSLIGRFGGEVRRFATGARARGPDPQRHLRHPRHRQPSAGCRRRAASGRPRSHWRIGSPRRCPRRSSAAPRSRLALRSSSPTSQTGASPVVAPATLSPTQQFYLLMRYGFVVGSSAKPKVSRSSSTSGSAEPPTPGSRCRARRARTRRAAPAPRGGRARGRSRRRS